MIVAGRASCLVAAVESGGCAVHVERAGRWPGGANELALEPVEELIDRFGSSPGREDESEVAVGGWCGGQAPGVPGVGSN